jgi:hypothetical protein
MIKNDYFKHSFTFLNVNFSYAIILNTIKFNLIIIRFSIR